ncbi:TetR family transcriptional regulator [Micromonospora musae]|uniref:TetR family transcriptional regulator n=1 Tax=Micromonospora musae TaxID=1894970 RepID=A0A3A9YLX2_9ACTN|nr:TetR/AcrR family transcriptional regulator C-terminal domain-containing protein [Micromonospora musae]RKN15009.1 TetR family transcriptional regulator [Micromonospora musae]RKN35537.1 TetR family transcriptional regulator [Micromonospora musae]
MSRPENSAGYARNTRDDVVEAALGILDQQGLPDLTMRHLAATLGIQPSGLYWHFPNKQALLAAVSDRIIAGARNVDADGRGWQERVRAEAAALRDALLAFKDGAEVVSSTLALGLGAEELQRRLTDAIDAGGFDRETSELAAATMVHFIVGHAFHEQQRIQADSLGAVAREHALDRVDPADAPVRPRAFEFGVTLLIAGLERRRTPLPTDPAPASA